MRVCPRTCFCPRCPPHPPSDGSKGRLGQPLSPHRPLARPQRAEPPRHTPGTLCGSCGAAAAALAAFLAAAGGQLLTGPARRRRSTFWPSPSRAHTPSLRLPRLPSPRRSGAQCGGARREARRDPEAGNRTTALLPRPFVVRFGGFLEVAEPPRTPWSRRRLTLGFGVCRGLRGIDKRPERSASKLP